MCTQGRVEGERDEPERRGERQKVTKLGRKYQYLQKSINTCHKAFLQLIF
jgi:hypothetical protein